jgi:hypothetical protein
MSRCRKCGLESEDGVAADGGLCFGCEQGSNDGVPDKRNGIELARSIVEGLAEKVGAPVREAAQEYANADYMNRHGGLPKPKKNDLAN